MKRDEQSWLKEMPFSQTLEEQLKHAFKASSAQISETLGASFRKSVESLGSAFQNVCSQAVKSGLETLFKGAKELSASFLSQLKPSDSSSSFLSSLFSSPMLGGAIKLGLGSLFEGIIGFFKTISQQKKDAIDKLYQEELKTLKTTFEQEIALRGENIKKLDKKLAAFSKAFQAGQLGASDYYQISKQIGQERNQEELEQARAKKLQELQTLEVTKKKEYDLESAKWLANRKKLNQLQNDINRLKQRQTVARQAGSLREINLARQGALTRVDKPTLFLAGEAGEELVKIRPLQAPINPLLEEKSQEKQQVFNFNINGFIGDEVALARRLTQMIQTSIYTLGEKEFKR